MKIKKLIINNYKNLNAELKHNSDIIAFIGNNGSGKSNLLEAICNIFRSLYVPKKYKADFDYSIEYINTLGNEIKIEKKGSQLNYFVDNVTTIDISIYLPKKIIAIYSGEDARLFDDCFSQFYLEFIKGINKANIQGNIYSELPKMLYLNKFYWNLSLLSLLISNSEDNKNFIRDILRISNVKEIKIKLDFNKKNYDEYNANFALDFVRTIDAQSEYKLEEFKENISKHRYDANDVYKYLYLAYTPKGTKIIDDITIKFNKNLTVTDLSEGEKKLLLIKAALEFAGQEDCIFILDEPDAHIHINNKEQIAKSFEPYKNNRQIIITTHSPTLTQCMQDENVYMLNSGKIEDRSRQEIIQEIAGDFWNKQQQNCFLSSNKKIILIVEGKHDKEHIKNAINRLGDEYKDLDFGIYSLGGESKIAPFLRGLYEANLSDNKLYIAIYDNDKAGKEALNHGYEKDNSKCGYRKLSTNKIEHNNFYAFNLPNPNKNESSCTIENLFDMGKYKNAFQEAFVKETGFNNNKSIDEIAENITLNAKNNLSEQSKEFDKEEFKHFRAIFDLVNAIKIEKEAISKTTVVNPVTSVIKTVSQNPAAITKIVTTPENTSFTEDSHLKDKSKNIINLYKNFRDSILALDDTISIHPFKDYIAFKKHKNVTDITIRKKSLKIWINLKKSNLNDPKKIAEDVSEKGHWGNGDYQISVTDETNFDYIIGLIKQAIKPSFTF